MLIALTGPSGIGKGYIKQKLLKAYPFIEELVWFTTRGPRPNEQNSNREFVTDEEFKTLAVTNELVLVQNDLFGHSYGIKKIDLLPNESVKLTEIHIDNVKQALEINSEILLVGIITHDFSIIRNRLSVIRKTEDSIEIEKRIISATKEVENILLNKNLFASIIEISKLSENTTLEQVVNILDANLKNMEGKLCL